MITLFRLCTLFFLACSPHVVGAQPYQSPIGTDSLQAEGLLGSRFGIPGTPTSYDYIVIGGGTAGIVIASRLAENQSATIALVEAGGFYEIDNGNFTQVPQDVYLSREYSWRLILPHNFRYRDRYCVRSQLRRAHRIH